MKSYSYNIKKNKSISILEKLKKTDLKMFKNN